MCKQKKTKEEEEADPISSGRITGGCNLQQIYTSNNVFYFNSQVVNVVSRGPGISVSGSNKAPELFLDMPRRLPTDSDSPMPGISVSCAGPIPNTSNCADCCPNGECMIGPGASMETT